MDEEVHLQPKVLRWVLTLTDARSLFVRPASALTRATRFARSPGRCGDHIVSWSIENRTAYACPTCQPPASTSNSGKAPAVIFPSHCARDDLSTMLCTPEKLTVKQLREALGGQGVTVKKSAKKAELVSALKFKLETDTPAVKEEPKRPTAPRPAAKRHLDLSDIASPAAAADEKRLAGEKRSVEHVPVETDF